MRYYGQWMRDEAEKRIGHLYPKIEVTAAMAQERPDLKPYVGRQLTVIAWLWARTVKSPNPAFAQVDVPLVSTFMLSTKAGKEAYVEPVIDGDTYRFTVKVGKPKDAERSKEWHQACRGANFSMSHVGSTNCWRLYLSEGKAGRMGARMMAIVAEGDRGRVYLPPTVVWKQLHDQQNPNGQPDVVISGSTQYLGVKPYGMENILTSSSPDRQLVALTTFLRLGAGGT